MSVAAPPSPADVARAPAAPGEPPASKEPGLPERLVSLDAFRGFIMTVLAAHGFGLATLEDDPGWEWLAGQFEHVAWEGMVFWDLIQPAFMFMVGLAMPYAFRARAERGGQAAVQRRVAFRAFKLILLSQVLMSVSRGELHFQLINVLAQIGLAYFCCYWILRLPFRGQLIAAGAILAGYTALFHLFPGSEGPWSKADNVGARIDQFFGLEYSGYYVTINFIPSTVTLLFGAWCGKWVQQDRVRNVLLLLGACVVGGAALSLFNPVVKRLWTASFTLLSGACVITILLGFYWLAEVKGRRRELFPLVVVGMNSIFIYSLNIVLWDWLGRAVGVFTGEFDFLGGAGPIAQAAAVFAVLWYLCYWLYRRRIFLKV